MELKCINVQLIRQKYTACINTKAKIYHYLKMGYILRRELGTYIQASVIRSSRESRVPKSY